MFNSIRSKLLLTHLGVVFFGMSIMGGVAYHMSRTYLETSERHKLHFIVNQMSEMVLQSFNYRKEVVERIADSPEVHNFSENFRVLALSEFLATFKKIFPDIGYINEEGLEEIRVVNGRINYDLRNFSDDPFFQRSREHPGKVLIRKKSTLDGHGGYSFNFFLGMKRYFGDEFTGTLLVGFPASDLSSVLKLSLGNDFGYAAIVDRSGAVLVASQTVDVVSPLFADDLNVKELLTGFGSGEDGEWQGTTMGVDYLVLYAPVKAVELVVVGAVNHDIFAAGPQRMRNAFVFIFLATCVLIVLLVYKLTAGMSRPIVSLAHAAEDVAAGNPTLIKLADRNDEIGQLLKSFNLMVKNLKKTTVSKNYMDSIVHSMGDSLMVIRNDDSVETVNLATCRLLGYKRGDEIIGHPFGTVIGVDPPHGLSWFGYLAQISDGERTEMHYRSKSGTLIPVLFSSSLLKSDKSGVIGVVCVAHDMTEVKKSEQKIRDYMERLKTSNAELEEFAYVASHDLQEPLRKISGFGERLQQKFGDILGDQGRDYLDRMDNAARRMQVLINDLLAYSRVKSKAKPFEKVELSRIVLEVLGDLEIRINDTDARINVGRLETVDADPLQMRQLFQNIIGNALKFRREGVSPEITITGLLRPAREIDSKELYEVTIADNGIGFEEKYAERIFGVFQRLHGRSTYEGSGVGLSICKKIAVRHGGDIVARSTPEVGTEFVITMCLKQSGEEV